MEFSEEIRLKFKDIVNQRCGLYFKDYDLMNLQQAISLRVDALKIDSPAAYYNFLRFSGKKEEEFRELLNLLTVNHTYFFRNESQFKVLKEKILPEIIQRKLNLKQGKPLLRIWSAGCSTGEEPYTIAMIIQEVIADIAVWDIQIMATDASTKVLDQAAKGIYGSSSMLLMPDDYRNKYFEVIQINKQEKYKIHDNLKQMVKFSFLNLIDEQYPWDCDIIFCRNVVIYFENETRIKIMHRMQESLNDQGYILIGHAESLQFLSRQFKMYDWQEAIYYRKLESEIKPKAGISQELSTEKYIEEIARAQVTAVAPNKKIEDLLVEIVKSVHLKHYEYALDLIAQAHKLDSQAQDPYYLAAEVLANQGKIKEAKGELKSALKINPLFAPAHYLFGTIYIEEGRVEEACEFLKKTLYLDSNFVLANFALANIYKNEGKYNDAIREYRNSLNILLKANSSDIIAYSGGFNVSALAGICKSNIERLKNYQNETIDF